MYKNGGRVQKNLENHVWVHQQGKNVPYSIKKLCPIETSWLQIDVLNIGYFVCVLLLRLLLVLLLLLLLRLLLLVETVQNVVNLVLLLLLLNDFGVELLLITHDVLDDLLLVIELLLFQLLEHVDDVEGAELPFTLSHPPLDFFDPEGKSCNRADSELRVKQRVLRRHGVLQNILK